MAYRKCSRLHFPRCYPGARLVGRRERDDTGGLRIRAAEGLQMRLKLTAYKTVEFLCGNKKTVGILEEVPAVCPYCGAAAVIVEIVQLEEHDPADVR